MSSNKKKDTLDRDQFLWYALKKGDTRALDMIYQKHIDYLFNYGLKLSSDREKTMDAIHDLFLELYKYRKKLSDDVNVKAYLTRALRNLLFKSMGSRLTLVEDSETLMQITSTDMKVESIEDEILIEEQRVYKSEQLKVALGNLTKNQVRALELRFQEGKSYEEIAEILSISVPSVRTSVYRAIKIVRSSI